MDKVLLITGGSRGIGKATCLYFLEKGYRVINLSRNNLALEGVTQFYIDLSFPDSIHQQKELLLSELKDAEKIVLVHCAASHNKNNILDIVQQELVKSLAINIVSPTVLTQIISSIMPAGSSIIYLGSSLSEKALPNTYSYSTNKHAVIGMMRATCQDLSGTGIHTVCVCPGFTDTEMLRHHINNNPNALFAITQKVSFKRLITPSEIAETLFFCSKTPAINGSVIHANLGQVET
ncbi:SDR family oxidoreductase [Parashewanella spongiae]|uniref:SDR family oxidoreductase n=1 Tax=Parashewanella spongiae TaxID=342950 RepID=A0A3A6TZ90_9GAMM|nr:SDR family oxidoreductase [Parashewanella spongiae]MCL1077552.1 SDR family oxidoreductase [Parashewanella spongiae]RJY18292.1 SDR family oxidoreductase [Parashewanella spongiae]